MICFEVTIETLDEALLAQKYDAKRVELCSALDLGGLTPSVGLMTKCVRTLELETHVLIRPRPGNFCYSNDEMNIMQSDIQTAAEIGVQGVVIGMLDMSGRIDRAQTKELTLLAKSLDLAVTFHRAIDFCTHLEDALQYLIEIGVDRILTSGQKPTAIEGLPMIRKMIDWTDGHIEIMAGSGINATNAVDIYASGVHAMHFSARKKQPSKYTNMGENYLPDEDKIKSILQVFNANK